ncbi:MAG TPA: protein phosphatase 2C domain-containing protein [Gemmatimonadaceae bacterium]|jgi:protein phosphatase|nr:protein phosphatase 2C domain-containing protein [Gemmatimonadaceae bacterium]
MTASSAILQFPEIQQLRESGRRPRDDELESFGITHTGLVRRENQDHFLIAQLRGRLNVKMSSLPAIERLPIEEERVGSFMMVADGVGGGQKGETASRIALEEIAQYISQAARCYYRENDAEGDFVSTLERAAKEVHECVIEQAAADPGTVGMATTLTLVIGVWPWMYLLQVGDSRYYIYANGVLRQISRDQTLAQEMVDEGIMSQSLSERSPLSNVLSSSIGGAQTAPVVTRLHSNWEHVHLLCTDGLNKHVSDEQIRQRLSTMTSAKQVCEDLLQDALDGGGSDNITIIVGRAVEKA